MLKSKLYAFFDMINIWIDYKKARRLSKKNKLDFIIGCVFDYQLRPYGYPKDGETTIIHMTSGRSAKYKAHIIKFYPGGTGQKDWAFEFLGYLD